MATLNLCVKYFNTENIYEILCLKKDCTDEEVIKAYKQMSKILHPDRVADLNKKAEAEEKFKLITQIKALLLNKHAKALYDKEGVVTIDTDIDTTNSAICVSAQEIDQLKNIYKGSEQEQKDIREAYMQGNGCINKIFESVPFLKANDEERVIEMIKDWIAAGSVPPLNLFTNESKAKRTRRQNKYAN